MSTDLRTWQFGSLVVWDNDAALPAGTTSITVTGGPGWTPGRYAVDQNGVQVVNLGAPDGVHHVVSTTKPPAGLNSTGGSGTAVVDGTRLVFDGNSLTAGYGIVSPSDFYPAQTAVLLGTQYAGTNYGVPGQTTQAMTADAAAQVDPLYVPVTQDILIAWEIGNDLDLNAATAAAAVQAFRDYCAARKAAGFRVVALTVTPRNAVNVGTAADWRARASTANALLRSDSPSVTAYARCTTGASYCDVLVDVASSLPLTDYSDPTYYQADTVHITTAGAGVVAADVANGIRTVLNPPAPDPPAASAAALLLVG